MSELKIKFENASVSNEAEKEEEKIKKWEVEDAVRCIIRAEELKQDTELMKLVAPELEKQKKAIVNAAEVLYGKENKKDEN